MKKTMNFSRSRNGGKKAGQPAEAGCPQGSQAGITCDPQVVSEGLPAYRVHRGIDFLKVSFWLSWNDPSFLELCERKKEALQATETEESLPLSSHGMDWNIFRTGVKMFSYRLIAADVVLMISPRGPSGNMPSARLEIGSLTSQTNLRNTLSGIRAFLENCGAEIKREQVSEVHMAADFIGLSIGDLDLQCQDRWIARSVIFDSHFERWEFTGCSLGKGDIMLRCYDKVLELRRSGHKQDIFAALWGVKRFNEQPVTRVEYQIRRPVLKTFKGIDCINGLSSPDVLLDALQAIWRYCTCDWARFMRTSVDRKNKNQKHSFLSEFWSAVKDVVWNDKITAFRSIQVTAKDLFAIRKQVLGGAMSVAAFFIDDLYDFPRIKQKLKELIEEDVENFYRRDEDEFVKRMIRKRNEALIDVVPF